MRYGKSLKPYALLLAVCLMWSMAGCPITADEWASIPQRAAQWTAQLPLRMQSVWRNWLLKGSSIPRRTAWEGELPLRVWLDDEAHAVTMPLEDYVLGVTAAEMPASYAEEALKSQAVAARTRAVYACLALGGDGCKTHAGCDLCTSASCCQAWKSEAQRRQSWGEEAAVYEARLQSAVAATSGELLTWEGMPAEILYHACSGGRTEDAAAVFAGGQPYLVSVDSPGEESYSGYESEQSMPRKEAANLLNQAFPGCGVQAEELAEQLRVLEATFSGRIQTLLVGSKTVSGTAFRKALNLRSTICEWRTEGEQIIFRTRGYGHGVGMSQAGAQAMAASGQDYRAILAHYYPGTSLSGMNAIP